MNTKPFTIEQHKHRHAAWAASTAARASKLCRFSVEKGIAILDACGFDSRFASPDQLPADVNIDKTHRKWRETAVAAACDIGVEGFTHGVAAKLINCYLNTRFVCGGHHEHKRVMCLHPPIDDLVLKALADKDFGGQAKQWRILRSKRWSKFDSDTYQDVIDLLRHSLPAGEPLWKIEEYWQGHQ
ncbi:MAG: hypothetical protein M5R41_19240 [Bacteroidia bacterium]|nr:hypothetical protein [Bacteroidia bacterium]